MIRIEFEEPDKEICNCCNNEIIRLTRFVYKDQDAFAIYYLKFTKGHEDKHAIGIISIGDWERMMNQKIDLHFHFEFGLMKQIIRLV